LRALLINKLSYIFVRTYNACV